MSVPVTSSTKKDPRALLLWGLLHLYCKLVWWRTSKRVTMYR